MRRPSRNAESELRKKVIEIQDAMCISMAGVADELNVSLSGLSLILARDNAKPEFVEKLDQLLADARVQVVFPSIAAEGRSRKINNAK